MGGPNLSDISKRNKSIEIADLLAFVCTISIAVLLLFILLMGIGSFILQIFTSFSKEIYTLGVLKGLIDRALILFLIIELYRITLAYLKSEPIVYEVFIAAFIAVGRKILIYDYELWGLQGAIALAVLLLALSIGYFLLVKSKGEREIR